MLGLPLAFILSQDQTLHCKKFNFVLALTGILFSYLKFIAALFQRTSFFSLHSFQPFVEPGGKHTTTFLICKKKFYFFLTSFYHLCLLIPLRTFFKAGCKSNHIFLISKFIFTFFSCFQFKKLLSFGVTTMPPLRKERCCKAGAKVITFF